MIAAIMQPYFFPYVGYFQLINAVDVFVFYDDVQYMKGGWVNRNRVRGPDGPVWLTLPVERLGLASLIGERRYLIDATTIDKTMARLATSYADMPAYAETASLVGDLLRFENTNVAAFNANLLTTIARKFKSRCRFTMSSAIDKATQLKGEERIIDICRRLGASHYLNAIGGVDLYSEERFASAGLQLNFLRTSVEPSRFGDESVHLSILDTLMHEGFARGTELMTRCEIVEPSIARPASA